MGSRGSLVLAAVILLLAGCGDSSHHGDNGASLEESVHHWNEVAIDASGRDHTPVSAAASHVYVNANDLDAAIHDHVFGEQLGPGRASRAIAIVQIAVFEALNAVEGGYESYLALAPAPEGASSRAAMAQAAHDALVGLYPSQAAIFQAELALDLAAIADGSSKSDGVEVGALAAATILARRTDDGSDHDEPRVGIEYLPGDAPGEWRPDPISNHPLALGARWGQVEPFVLASAHQFRAPPPPALDSAAYATAFDEVSELGGDGEVTPSARTQDQTEIGIYWAYDGTPSLCAPPRLYNQIAVQIAEAQGTDAMELARLLALVNVSMADAGIAIWESKYYYKFWRPVGGIREDGDPTFTPLGAPASNLTGPNFTPPFPA